MRISELSGHWVAPDGSLYLGEVLENSRFWRAGTRENPSTQKSTRLEEPQWSTYLSDLVSERLQLSWFRRNMPKTSGSLLKSFFVEAPARPPATFKGGSESCIVTPDMSGTYTPLFSLSARGGRALCPLSGFCARDSVTATIQTGPQHTTLDPPIRST